MARDEQFAAEGIRGRAKLDQLNAELDDLAIDAVRHQNECTFDDFLCPGNDVFDAIFVMDHTKLWRLLITSVLRIAEQRSTKDV